MTSHTANEQKGPDSKWGWLTSHLFYFSFRRQQQVYLCRSQGRSFWYVSVPKFLPLIFILDLLNVKLYWDSFLPSLPAKKECRGGEPHIWRCGKGNWPSIPTQSGDKMFEEWEGMYCSIVFYHLLAAAFTLALANMSLYLTMNN